MKYYKNANQLEVGDKLCGYLNKFKTIDDFRVDEEPDENDVGSQQSSSLKQNQQGKKRHRTTSDTIDTTTTTAQNDATN